MKLSIIMYHYVRELRYSRFPEIKGLETDQFEEQIAYIKKHYNVISGDDLLAAAETKSLKELPVQALLLTYDDGYSDHFAQVFPILVREKLSGCFFPPVECMLGDRVLDANKIHFVLAAVPDKRAIVDYIFRKLDKYNGQYGIHSQQYYWTKLAVASRFDPKEVVFIKRILQRELPEKLRKIIIGGLFQKYVTSDEASFARELYMSVEQVKYMRSSGMYVGSHGHGHYWLDDLDPPSQRREIELAVGFLEEVGTCIDSWIMCYPYGAYNDSVLSILSSQGCKIGLTTKVGIADLQRDSLLTLPRLDTNDLPKNANAKPNGWTLKAKAIGVER